MPPAAGGIWIMLSGVVSVVLGVLIWRGWPLSGDQAVGILIGIKLILDGIVLIAVASAARAAGAGARLGVIIHHTDAEREWAYDRESHVGRLDKALDEAQDEGWTVVDMKRDWKAVHKHRSP